VIVFTPPTVEEVVILDGASGLRTKVDRGVSVLKTAGAYRQVRSPSQLECIAADVVYLGGHEWEITDQDEYAALIAAGYGTYLHQRPTGLLYPGGDTFPSWSTFTV